MRAPWCSPLDKAVNPAWFTEDELPLVVPMPSAAWARASADGPVLDFTVPANATKIYNYLAAASKSLSTYATDPLWHAGDGLFQPAAAELEQRREHTRANLQQPQSGVPGQPVSVSRVPRAVLVAALRRLDLGDDDERVTGQVDLAVACARSRAWPP